MTDIVLDETAWEGVEDGAEALVDRWLVHEGAAVEAGQPVVRVVVVKSTMDVPAPVAGRLERILVRGGASFRRGQPLGEVAPGKP